ncbi:MAG: hypothetical protein P9M14_18485, partial [Candidatus Alcyoniella australis]|nr:hypothetical protein [Candidatus Alcyoniella australis]
MISRRACISYFLAAASGLGLGCKYLPIVEDCPIPLDDNRYQAGNGSADCRVLDRAPSKDTNDPDIIFMISDCLRHDYFNQNITTNLWEMSNRGIRFENYFVNAGFTKASCASLFSGLLPRFERLGEADTAGFDHLCQNPLRCKGQFSTIPRSLITFPELIKKSKKYITISATQNPLTSHKYGYGKKYWDFHKYMGERPGEYGGKRLAEE